MRPAWLLAAAPIALLSAGAHAQTAPAPTAPAPTAATADAFVAGVEQRDEPLQTLESRIAWVNNTFITDDTDAIAADAGAKATERGVAEATQAARFNATPGLSFDTRRKLDLLKNGLTLPAPTRPGASVELSTISTRLASEYGKGKGTLGGEVKNGNDLEALMGTERDPARLTEMWTSWHDNVGAPMRGDYTKLVQISDQGARELGFADVGALWRSGYDMPPDKFAAYTDTLWKQVEPLYQSLHAYVRWKLNAKYGDAVQPKSGPIRADLLGNMWAQEWGNIYDVVAPAGQGDVGFDLTQLLTSHGYDAVKMTKTAEGFYSSLGFAPLPATFWDRAQLTKPRDREVICHASAWDIDGKDDLRVKACLRPNADDFVTIHHELGHNYYQRAYNGQPFLYRNGANDGFHEAIGDFVALSITPQYLVRINLLDQAKVPSADKDIGLLLRQALDKVAFLPFGLLVDKWRWGVFSGAIPASGMQKGWDDLRRQYQGVVPPVARDETRFDPGAKFHIPATTPYMRYFLARLLQFQFYQAACKQAGWKGPLHRCTIYGDKAVGARFNKMLEMGQSRPWPEALAAFTGSRDISGQAMVAYFAPLKTWLDQQNKGHPIGW